jgi:hypothetical protein
MSSLEDGFGGGVDDMVSANTGELRITILGSSGLSRVRGCATGRHGAKSQMAQNLLWRLHRQGFSNYTTDITWLYYDILPPPLRLDPMYCMNLGLPLSGGE